MNDLLKKLNTLVQAQLNSILGEGWRTRHQSLDPSRLGKNVDDEVSALRRRIDDALAYEEKLETQVQQLATEVARLDKAADEAVLRDDDAAARHAIDMLQRTQQRYNIAEADLNEHRLVTQELIRRVNELEAIVTEARQRQAEEAPEATGTAGGSLSELLRDVRQKVPGMAQQEASPDTDAYYEEEERADERAVEDDLSQRRRRLSKPGS